MINEKGERRKAKGESVRGQDKRQGQKGKNKGRAHLTLLLHFCLPIFPPPACRFVQPSRFFGISSK
jgi:hypothetical protein